MRNVFVFLNLVTPAGPATGGRNGMRNTPRQTGSFMMSGSITGIECRICHLCLIEKRDIFWSGFHADLVSCVS